MHFITLIFAITPSRFNAIKWTKWVDFDRMNWCDEITVSWYIVVSDVTSTFQVCWTWAWMCQWLTVDCYTFFFGLRHFKIHPSMIFHNEGINFYLFCGELVSVHLRIDVVSSNSMQLRILQVLHSVLFHWEQPSMLYQYLQTAYWASLSLWSSGLLDRCLDRDKFSLLVDLLMHY